MSGLRFLLDENVPRSVMKFLTSGENYVVYVPKSTENSNVIQLALKPCVAMIEYRTVMKRFYHLSHLHVIEGAEQISGNS